MLAIVLGLLHLHTALAAGFITPGFFAAGAALVGIPILIHILNRRKFKVVRWAAMEYLLQAMRKNRRRLKFEQWILLATRCAVLMLLGAALARPLACDSNPMTAFAAQRAGLHVFIIDNGYSMSYETPRPNSKNQLDQAKIIVKQYIDRLAAGGESVMIITTARPADYVISKPNYDLQAARAAVDRVEQSYNESDIPRALDLALKAGQDNSKSPNKSLYILSDNTRCSWQGAQGEKIKAIAARLPDVFKTTVHLLGKADQWNQAIVDLQPDTNLVSTKFNLHFIATARRFGGHGGLSNLQWKVDDVTLAGGSDINVDADTPPVISASQKIDVGGPHVLSASLSSDDHLKTDNTRMRVVEVFNELKVLIVEGQRGLGALEGSGAFLSVALAPPRDAMAGNNGRLDSESPISPELIGDTELPNKVLSSYRAVILADVGTLSDAAADQLQRFVEAGGTLMLYMGKQVNGDVYNRLLLGKAADGKARHLLPGKLVKVMSSDLSADKKPFNFEFNPKGVVHPYLEPFRNVENSGLSTAQVFSYWQVDLPADGTVERVLNYSAHSSDGPAPNGAKPNAAQLGDPAITVHTVGSGRVVFVSTSAGPEWTSLPAKRNYVALVSELLTGSVNAGDGWMNLTTGQVLAVPVTLGLTDAPKLVDPAKKPVPLENERNAEGQMAYHSRPLQKPGIYKLNTGGNTEYPIAVNIPGGALDVRTVPEKTIKEVMANIDLYVEGDSVPANLAGRGQENEMSWYFMVAVMALAGVETFMAMRFGHQRRLGAHAQVPIPAGSLKSTENALGIQGQLTTAQRFRQNGRMLLGAGLLWLLADAVMGTIGMKVSLLIICIPIGLLIVAVYLLVRYRGSNIPVS